MLGRKPVTIRQWLFKRRLFPDGLDERNRPLFWPQTLRDAEAVVRRTGLTGNGSDPRRARRKAVPQEAAAESGDMPGELCADAA